MEESVKSVVLVEDDIFTSRLIKSYFENKGVMVHQSFDISSAFRNSIVHRPSGIILDVYLPTSTSISVFDKLKKLCGCPIVFYTSDMKPGLELEALKLGASDFVLKERGVPVLYERVTKCMGQKNYDDEGVLDTSSSRNLEVGGLTISVDSNIVEYRGERIAFSVQEFNILYYMLSNIELVISRDELCYITKGQSYDGYSRNIDLLVSRVNKKLSNLTNFNYRIRSVRSRGYVLKSVQ